ncbi:hypothetical protein BCR44DRAFT_33801 [Catenaria anguillulae PL171]|uniref:Uncharacterized protein n=1 Tax=Catenaria anguillulae PL171 TaxID=765915 RepID=A0A1Y2HMZ0_9FUNG|nr:hypothetical protein BCR44DRAFT_33801 [Catenaria anguillulae PL171]
MLNNVQAAVRTTVNFQNEIQPVITTLLEPIKDGAVNGQPTPGNLLKNENLRLFLFIVYLFEFSRIQFTDKLHLCFPQPTSSEPFQQLMATKISTSTFVMAALLKGSTGSSNRPADIALAKKLVVGLAAPAIADKLKVESKNKRIIGSPRALMDKLADMEKRVLGRITPKGEKGSLRPVVQMNEAAEEWRRWAEARNMEARAKAAAAAKVVVATVSLAASTSVSSPQVATPIVPDGSKKGLPTVDSGAETLVRPQAANVSDTPQEQLALKCALPLSRTGSDAAMELRHASSSEATVADQSNQPTTLGTHKVIESVVAAVGNLSAVEQAEGWQ